MTEVSSTDASRVSSGGIAVSGGRCVAEVAAHRGGVLHLDRSDLPRGGTEPVEPRGERGARDVGPPGERAEPQGALNDRDTAELREPRDVDNRTHEGSSNVGRVEVGSTGEHPGTSSLHGQRLSDVRGHEVLNRSQVCRRHGSLSIDGSAG